MFIPPFAFVQISLHFLSPSLKARSLLRLQQNNSSSYTFRLGIWRQYPPTGMYNVTTQKNTIGMGLTSEFNLHFKLSPVFYFGKLEKVKLKNLAGSEQVSCFVIQRRQTGTCSQAAVSRGSWLSPTGTRG